MTMVMTTMAWGKMWALKYVMTSVGARMDIAENFLPWPSSRRLAWPGLLRARPVTTTNQRQNPGASSCAGQQRLEQSAQGKVACHARNDLETVRRTRIPFVRGLLDRVQSATTGRHGKPRPREMQQSSSATPPDQGIPPKTHPVCLGWWLA